MEAGLSEKFVVAEDGTEVSQRDGSA